MNPHALLNQLRQRSHLIQGQRVALDKDVAPVYGVSIGTLRRRVVKNIARFPPDLLIIQEGQYYFTEAGILMLSVVLKTPQAAGINVAIIRELFGFQNN